MIDQINAKLEEHGYTLKDDQLDLLTIGDNDLDESDEEDEDEDEDNVVDMTHSSVQVTIQGETHTATPKNKEGIVVLGNKINNVGSTIISRDYRLSKAEGLFYSMYGQN